jgi:predicted DNA-binding transcriptional regulator AlpA
MPGAPLHLLEHRDMARNFNALGALPQVGYVRQSQLIPAIFPFSSATLWRKVKAGTFPRPVKLGPRITAWRVEDIYALVESLGR